MLYITGYAVMINIKGRDVGMERIDFWSILSRGL